MTAPTYSKLPDEALIGLCLAGDRDAWSALIRRYERLIHAIPRRYGLDEPDRLDVFQAVCVTLLEKLDTLRDRRSLAGWLVSTTARTSFETQRRRRRESGDLPEDALTEPDLPAARAQALEEQALLRVALDRLSPRCRRILEFTFLSPDGASYREIARDLDMPEGSVGPTRGRCLEKLRLALRDLGVDA